MRLPVGTRRSFLTAVLLAGATQLAWPLTSMPVKSPQIRLNREQTRAFQAWMLRIISAQLEQGPSPRWQHRDCAGLVRFAVNEALVVHDAKWLHANGVAGNERLPPELELSEAQKSLRNRWIQPGGGRGAFVSALGLVQENSRFVSRELNQAEAGDLLFFDQADDQHLMVWMGSRIAYHTGTVTAEDNGLRIADIQQLKTWKDTRWQPAVNNPNFVGVFRLAFLS